MCENAEHEKDDACVIENCLFYLFKGTGTKNAE